MLHASLVGQRDEENEEMEAAWAADHVPAGASWQTGPRYSDRPMDPETRLFGLGGVFAVVLLILGGMFFTWRTYTAAPAQATLSVFDVAPPAAPPEPPSELPTGPEQVEREQPRPVVREQATPPPPEMVLPSAVPLPRVDALPEPGPPVKETTAPDSKPMPPAPTKTADKSSWEGQVLAALNKVKRYPRTAMSRRQQGVPYIRFVLDREGRVISARLERSSGFAALDDEAASLPKRAQPLPKPPDHVKGDRIEMIVQVEFFMR